MTLMIKIPVDRQLLFNLITYIVYGVHIYFSTKTLASNRILRLFYILYSLFMIYFYVDGLIAFMNNLRITSYYLVNVLDIALFYLITYLSTIASFLSLYMPFIEMLKLLIIALYVLVLSIMAVFLNTLARKFLKENYKVLVAIITTLCIIKYLTYVIAIPYLPLIIISPLLAKNILRRQGENKMFSKKTLKKIVIEKNYTRAVFERTNIVFVLGFIILSMIFLTSLNGINEKSLKDYLINIYLIQTLLMIVFYVSYTIIKKRALKGLGSKYIVIMYILIISFILLIIQNINYICSNIHYIDPYEYLNNPLYFNEAVANTTKDLYLFIDEKYYGQGVENISFSTLNSFLKNNSHYMNAESIIKNVNKLCIHSPRSLYNINPFLSFPFIEEFKSSNLNLDVRAITLTLVNFINIFLTIIYISSIALPILIVLFLVIKRKIVSTIYSLLRPVYIDLLIILPFLYMLLLFINLVITPSASLLSDLSNQIYYGRYPYSYNESVNEYIDITIEEEPLVNKSNTTGFYNLSNVDHSIYYGVAVFLASKLPLFLFMGILVFVLSYLAEAVKAFDILFIENNEERLMSIYSLSANSISLIIIGIIFLNIIANIFILFSTIDQGKILSWYIFTLVKNIKVLETSYNSPGFSNIIWLKITDINYLIPIDLVDKYFIMMAVIGILKTIYMSSELYIEGKGVVDKLRHFLERYGFITRLEWPDLWRFLERGLFITIVISTIYFIALSIPLNKSTAEIISYLISIADELSSLPILILILLIETIESIIRSKKKDSLSKFSYILINLSYMFISLMLILAYLTIFKIIVDLYRVIVIDPSCWKIESNIEFIPLMHESEYF